MRMEDIQHAVDRIRNAVRTETAHRDAVMEVDIVGDPEMEMKSEQEQQEQNELQVDSGLTLEEGRKVDSRYILPRFPCSL